MNIIVSGQHLKLTDAIKEYAETKCGKVGKYLENITEIRVNISVEKLMHKADATIFASGKTIRVESEDTDLYAAIDKMADIMERQVRKYKEKCKKDKGGTNFGKVLNKFLSNLTILSKKVQNYHWNIEGKGFFTIHAKLDDIYEELNEGIDEVAERILAIGYRPLSNFKSYLENATLKEADNEAIYVDEAIKNLLLDFKYIVDEAKEIKVQADEVSDYGTSAIMDEFILKYEKLIWMIKAYSVK